MADENVKGDIHIISEGENRYLRFNEGGSRKYALRYRSSTGSPSEVLTVYNYFKNDDVLAFDKAGNVGVGTATPSKKLHVDGTVRATALEVCSKEENAYIHFVAANAKSGQIGVQDQDDQGFYVHIGGAYHLNVNQNGNVAIGKRLASEGIKLDVDGSVRASSLELGGADENGSITLRNKDGKATISLDSDTGSLIGRNKQGQETIILDYAAGDVVVGGASQGGNVIVRTKDGVPTLRLDGSSGKLTIRGGDQEDHDISILNNEGEETIYLDGNDAGMAIGGKGKAGEIIVRDPTGYASLRLGGHSCTINKTHMTINKGDLKICRQSEGTWRNMIVLANDGQIQARNHKGELTVNINGATANIDVGGYDENGDIVVKNASGQKTIHLDGGAGDILLNNADVAEDFDVTVGSEAIEPGTVMVLDDKGALRASRTAYDRRVAGVISGAGCHKPGIVLDKQPTSENRLPIALVGKVFCKVDAAYGAISVGDLLTTSPTPGHAMRVGDPAQALGAILGKATSCLENGKGLIPILVALQ